MIVLIEILHVLIHIVEESPEIFKQLKSAIIESFGKTLIPLLEEARLEKALTDVSGQMVDAIVQLFCLVVDQISEEELLNLVSTCSCLQTLRALATKLFSCKPADAVRSREIGLLKALLRIVSMPSLVSIASGQQIAGTIELFVGIISKCQEKQIETGFTCQERSRYHWAALCLRSVSRSAVVVHHSFKPWVWGPHWLYKNDMDWLIQFLNDDERGMQKIGLGILGNLILIKDSYEHLCVKIPQFLDV